MIEPTIALVFSPEPWVEHLHRHLADHGGARVRQIVLDPALALEESYDALVVSHRWPGLTSRFVKAVQARGSAVLGVFDPAEPAGEAYLRGLDVDRVVGADVPIAELVAAITAVGGDAPVAMGAARVAGPPIGPTRARRAPLVVTGVPGAGASEIALGIAVASARHHPTVLVDAHEHGSSLATRLGLPPEPGLLAAVDAVEHGLGELSSVCAPIGRGLAVVVGVPGTAVAAQLRGSDVTSVLEELADGGSNVIVDVATGPDATIGPHIVSGAGTLVFVAPATPLGVTRTLGWFARGVGDFSAVDVGVGPGRSLVQIVFNRAPRERFRRAELEHEVSRTLTACDVAFVPTDPRVDDAMWRGALVGRGPFSAAVVQLADAVANPDARAHAPVALAGRRARRVA